MRRFLLVLCILLPAWARAEGVTSLMKGTANEILRDGAPGVAMVVIAGDQTYYWNAGSSGRKGLAVTNRTLFETASITKSFTTTLLGIDVARGTKSLNAPVQRYLRGYKLRPGMKRATLKMLATFTAGLPQAPPDYLRLPKPERDIGHYSVKRFLRFVSHWTPPTRLPAPRAYADASVGLLGLCLGDLHLGTWERRLRTEIFDPLGMSDTAMSLDPEQERRLAEGRQTNGSRAIRWPVDAMAPSDGVKSTTFDLAQFLAAALGENEAAPSDLLEGMGIATRTGFLVHFSDSEEFQALAWRQVPVDVGGRRWWIVTKSGGLPGFSCAISFNRRLGIGAAILTNVGELDVADIELGLVKRLAMAR